MKYTDIQYREFYDVPRIFLFRVGGSLFLAECSFDDQMDDYCRHYDLFELPSDTPLEGSWDALHDSATRNIGQISVSDVVFDETKRRQVDLTSFDGRF